MAFKYDCVYYWLGGTENGEWKKVNVSRSIDVWSVIEEIKRGGRHAVPGSTKVGAPEGPPTTI